MPHSVSSSSSAQAPVSPAPSARAAQVDDDFARALDAANSVAADEFAAGDSFVSPQAPSEPRSRAADDAESEEQETRETERRPARRGQTTPDVVLALALAPLAVPKTPMDGEPEVVAASTGEVSVQPTAPAADPQAPARAQQIVANPSANSAAKASREPTATDEGIVSLIGTTESDPADETDAATPSKATPDAGDAAAKPAVAPSGAPAHQTAAAAVAVARPATQDASSDPLAPTAASDPAVAPPDPTAPSPNDGASADAGGGEGQQGAGGQTHASQATEADTPAAPQNGGAASSASASSAVPSIDPAAARPAPSLTATSTPTTPQATAALASAVVSNAVAAASAGLRRTRFEVQLDGSDLGRIDVRLDIGRGGRVGAKLTVDSAEARDLLQNDARALQRTLEQAGFRLSEGGFTVEVRSGGADAGDPQARREPAGGLPDAAETDTPIGRDAAPTAYRPLRAAASALDVRV
ncbi:flagellar hook-length control protein FliK [Methylopila sp. 73B]|uniref:flagellar hook-length control protein FliK n=1 Tax=Methylopila sp. 73B TaxID=1120792 RepID=UPI000361BC36|nr:flagellar hook-length control protein FliK [Methylopila sp. 73B]